MITGVIGTQLGPYHVESLLGRGGMGEVYRATDTVLGRQVAIKVLPSDFAADSERGARFRREATILASLSHPNIGAIYGVETVEHENGRTIGLVLELVEGPTLAEKLQAGPLPVDEVVFVARQIAAALDAAHQQGIVHRDLKPSNIKLREDGTVKVLDFGLAKAADIALSSEAVTALQLASMSPTITSPAMTAAGMILGTAAYMSPEQARGKPIDKRVDIWAFGAVLYEMLTARPAFGGDDVTEIMAAVVKQEPDWTAVPARMRPLLERCLRKDPRRRLRDIGDALFLFDDTSIATPAVRSRSALVAWTIASAATVIALGLVAFMAVVGGRPAAEERTVRLALPLPEGWTLERAANTPLAVSPDGRYVAIVGRAPGRSSSIFVRDLESGNTQLLPGTAGASSLFWSPDSRFLGFFAGGALKRIAATGGPVTTIGDGFGTSLGGTWGRDGTIVFASLQQGSIGLKRVPAAGGAPREALPPPRESGEVHAMPSFLPDGRHLLYTAYQLADIAAFTPVPLYVQALDSLERSKIADVGSRNVQYANGQLLYVLDGTLMTQPFDPDRRSVTGEATPIAAEIQRGLRNRDGHFSASQTGVLVYQTGASEAVSQLAWMDRGGKTIAKVAEPAFYRELALSPDGKRAVTVSGPALWIVDLARGVTTRLTTTSALYNSPSMVARRSPHCVRSCGPSVFRVVLETGEWRRR